MKTLSIKPIAMLAGLVSVTMVQLHAAGLGEPAQGSSPDDVRLQTVALWLLVSLMLGVILVSMWQVMRALHTVRWHLDGRPEQPQASSLTKAVPLDQEHQILMHHDYDGIRELDNQLPPWWVALFYLTIAFGGVYVWYYHFRGEPQGQAQEYLAEMAQADEEMKLLANRVDENTVQLLTEPARIKAGEAIFQKNCVACHGKLGEGGVGPNLTDAYWLHGGTIQRVFKTIKYGVPAKGMIPWQAQLGPSQIQEVASYIRTLQNTNPPGGKEPQGEKGE